MTVEITRNSDGSVTLTVGGWVGPDPERIEAGAAALSPTGVRDDVRLHHWKPYAEAQARNVLAAAYPVGPVLTLTAEAVSEFIEAGAKALAEYEHDEVAFQSPVLDGVTRSGNSEDYYRKRARIVFAGSGWVR